MEDKYFQVLKKYLDGDVLDNRDLPLVERLEGIGCVEVDERDDTWGERTGLEKTATVTPLGREFYEEECKRRGLELVRQ